MNGDVPKPHEPNPSISVSPIISDFAKLTKFTDEFINPWHLNPPSMPSTADTMKAQHDRVDRLTGFDRSHFNDAAAYSMMPSAREMIERQAREIPAMYERSAWASYPAPSPKEPVDSAEYKAARAAVSKWIIPAPEQCFDDIIGNDEALAHIRDAIEAPVKHAALYAAYGMKMPKGVLLSGPPGCGKTMFARAAASEMKRLYGDKVEFLSIAAPELQSRYIGQTEERIKAIFTFAREYKKARGHPLLVFIDEAETILPDRTGSLRQVYSFEESQVAAFLAEMDGMQESGAFVMLATNRPEAIDQALLRDGRCDIKVVVKRPDQDSAQRILKRCFASGVRASAGETIDALVFAAEESLYDPNKVLLDATGVGVYLGKEEIDPALIRRHFLLEHIISGAMIVSIPARAKRYAFARDKETGIVSGVTQGDVVAAVNDIFNENKGLNHSFAFDSFKKELLADVVAESKKKMED